MNFAALEKNIMDSVSESILKLGFAPLPVTLYFPIDALCTLLEENIGSDMMSAVLKMFSYQVRDRLGEVKCDLAKDGRYAITVPPEGVRYVHDHSSQTDFTSALVRLMEEPDADIMEIISLFRAYGETCVRRTDGEDMDYVLYFRSGEPDDYRYCFHEEMGRMIYHRFTPAEFERFGIEV